MRLKPVAPRKTVINALNLKHIDRFLQADEADTLHELLDLLRVVGPGPHERSAYLVERELQDHGA